MIRTVFARPSQPERDAVCPFWLIRSQYVSARECLSALRKSIVDG